MSKEQAPSPKELEKELNHYLSDKYGDKIRLSVPLTFPDPNGFKTDEPSGKMKKQKKQTGINFDTKPIELEEYLNDYVIKQDSAKEILATKVCTHFNRINKMDRSSDIGNVKNNIIMLGPTGVGKTFLIKLIAQKIGVPFVKGDATKFSETGYVGGDVEDLVRDLVRAADNDIEKAQYGIIYIDEIDKIAGSRNSIGLDVSRTGVQRTLLKPMEETEVDLKVPHDIVSQIEAVEYYRKTGKREKRVINTKNILFIVSGAFNDIGEIIKDRLNRQNIGFQSALKNKDDTASHLKDIKSEDLVKYGFESEFIGRLPVIATFYGLESEDLLEILKTPNSPIMNSKKKDFRAYGIDIRFEEKALKEIACMAFKEKTGARGIISVLEKILIKFEKQLPSTDIKKFVVTHEVVANPERELKKILSGELNAETEVLHTSIVAEEKKQLKKLILDKKHLIDDESVFLTDDLFIDVIVGNSVDKSVDYKLVIEEAALIVEEIREYEGMFKKYHNIDIHFNGEALSAIIEKVLLNEVDVSPFLDKLLSNYNHGLKLVFEKSGKKSFLFTKNTIENPQAFLNKLIKNSYNRNRSYEQ